MPQPAFGERRTTEMRGRKPSQALAICFIVAVSPQRGLAGVPRYCVEPVEIDRVPAKTPVNLSRGPDRFVVGDDTANPIAVDHVQTPDKNPKYVIDRQVMWRFGADFRLHGPYDLKGFQMMGSDGTVTYLKHGEYRTSAGTAQASSDDWIEHLYTVESGKLPKLIRGPLARADWEVRPLRFDQRLGGAIVSMSRKTPKGPDQIETYLVRGDSIRRIADTWRIPGNFYSSPQHNVDVFGTGDRSTIELTDRKTGHAIRLELPQAGDNEMWSWESLNIDRYGWLFAEGNGNDYAIKLRDDGKRIKAETIYRYTGYGWPARILHWLIDKRAKTPITWTYHSRQCVRFSQALELTLFCKPLKVLVEGKLRDIGDGSAPLAEYVGDAQSARVALFTGTDGSLYAYDGRGTQLVRRDLGRWADVQDLPASRQTFVVAGNASFRLAGAFPKLRLDPVDLSAGPRSGPKRECCLSLGPRFASVIFRSFPQTGDVLAFSTESGVWEMENARTAQSLWRPVDSPIDLRNVSPAAVWNGMVFMTIDHKPYRIGRCGRRG
jgi:hypothetical protein